MFRSRMATSPAAHYRTRLPPSHVDARGSPSNSCTLQPSPDLSAVPCDSPTPAYDRASVKTIVCREYGSVAVEETCLLYTSDAADERSSVDLGGRRIIKK